jgi:hypothetical protein
MSTHAVWEPHTFFSGRMSGVDSGTMCVMDFNNRENRGVH